MRKWIDLVESQEEIFLELRDMRHNVESMGGIFDWGYSDNTIEIDMISIPLDRQRQGYGTEIIHKVCDIADKYSCDISLEAAAYGKKEINQKGLERFYEKFGFVKTGEAGAGGHPVMLRKGEQS
jgi:GNAT superfamily N-acetyltransferase